MRTKFFILLSCHKRRLPCFLIATLYLSSRMRTFCWFLQICDFDNSSELTTCVIRIESRQFQEVCNVHPSICNYDCAHTIRHSHHVTRHATGAFHETTFTRPTRHGLEHSKILSFSNFWPFRRRRKSGVKQLCVASKFRRQTRSAHSAG